MIITMDMLTRSRKSGAVPGEYRCICPACGHDTFYYNTKTRFFCCFRESCGIKGKFRDSDEESTFTPSQSLLELKDSVSKLFVPKEEVHEIDLDLFSDPLNENTIKDYVFVYYYIKKRKFTLEDIDKYHIRVGKSYYDKQAEKTVNKWKGRIIFPFFEDGIPVYAIGRSYNDMLPKYLNTDGEKSVIVYNIDQIKDRTCIVCEGLIS